MTPSYLRQQTPVDQTYIHVDKVAAADGVVNSPRADLKWYNLARSDQPVDVHVLEMARRFIRQMSEEGCLDNLGDLGFVILHRCERDFYFLIVCSWKNNNELWESVFAKTGADDPSFSDFVFTDQHRGTFCVWELGIISHEQKAWRRFLMSIHDDNAKHDYLSDVYVGRV